MLTHYEPTFKCEKCQKMFTLKSELNRHSKACGSRVRCTMCPKIFTNIKYLHDHMSSKDASPNDWKNICQICPLKPKFQYRVALHQHQKRCHINPDFLMISLP